MATGLATTNQSNTLAPAANGNNKRFDLALIEAQIKEVTPVLREMVVGGRKLNDDQIKGRAMFAITHGLDPITEVHTITDGQGRTMAHSMSINGLRRKNQEQAGQGTEILMDFVELTEQQLKKFPGALIGYECQLRDGQTYTQWQRRVTEIGKSVREAMGQAVSFKELMELVGKPPIYTGVGIIYQSELSDYKDKNFNPIERAKKRAEVNARHHRWPTEAPVFEGEETVYEPLPESPATQPPADVQQGEFREETAADQQERIMGELYSDPEPRQRVTYTREDAAADMEQDAPMVDETLGDDEELSTQPPAQNLPPLRLQPASLKDALAQKAAKDTGPEITPARKGLIATVIESELSMTTNPKASRKQVLKFLTNHDSLTELNNGMLNALYAWLKPTKNETSGEWFADPMASRELLAAFNACQPDQPSLI